MFRRRALFVLAVLVIAALGFSGIALVYERSKAALIVDAEQDLNATAHKAADDASNLFQPATQIIDRILDAQLPELGPAAREQTLFALASYPIYSLSQVDGIYVGTADGSFFHLTDLIPNEFIAGGETAPHYRGALRREVNRENGAATDTWYFQDTTTHAWHQSKVHPVPAGYDPRERPWYKAAIEHDGMNWGRPYIYASTKDIGITLSAPIKDANGKLWGVVGVDYSLRSLAKIVAAFDSYHLDTSGFMFIGDDTGELIGHPLMARAQKAMNEDNKLTIEQATSIQNLHLENNDDVSVFNALANKRGVIQHALNGNRDIISIKLPLDPSLGLPEYVYVGQPQDAVIGVAIGELRRNISILLALLAIVALIAFYAAKLRGEISARKRTELALRESEAYTKILFQESNVPIVVMDPATNRFLDCNPAAVAIYGLPDREAVLGKTSADVSAPTQYDGTDSRTAVDRRNFDSIESGNMVFEWRHQRPDGVVWDSVVRFMSFIHGGRKLFQFTLEDITDRKRADEAMKQAKELAEEATKTKSSFLAMMSHEIRTPMNGVMAMAEMLDQTDLTDDQRDMSSVIRSSSAALLTIINDILDFSKIEAGKLDIEKVPFSLVELVEGAGELISARTEERGIGLIVDLDTALPDLLVGDPVRLRQILLNLMGNAAKFTEFGHVAVRVMAAKADAADIRLRFEISDTGIGLTEEQRSRLFQPFMQADSSTARKYGGTGLGLSICHRLCVMMDGDIGVHSVAGEGSTFWFELPFAISDAAALKPAIDIADTRLLAIGFPAPERDSLMRLITAAGIADIVWEDTAELFPDERPQRIVLLRADPHAIHPLEAAQQSGPERIVILAASHGMASTLASATRSGVFATLTLPIRRQRLWHTIAAALGRADLNLRQAATGNKSLGWSPPSIEDARTAGALILVAEDNLTNQIVIRRMLDQRGYAYEIADNGVVALSLYERGGYGLLLTDFHMPEMDGFQLTAAIRKREAESGQRLPIVALTADALPGTQALSLDAGMDAYLTKPIDSKALTDVLEKYLPQAAGLRRRPEKRAQKSRTARAQNVSVIDPEILDLERMREAFGAMDEEAMSFLVTFIDDVPRMIDGIGAGLTAANHAKARDAAHALKGAARSAGANRLGQIAADIQDRLDDNDPDTASFLFEALALTYDELRLAFDTFRATTSIVG